ncbi:pyruvate kinase [Lachnoclostridium sp. An196]|uniref:pyruvate kinase n=1 Tax=Lachnoclostridium sp. An196 TaxID=1965583 RepID=UPI000B38D407|nr:pyruvate kinase [Lachnoclostridium sp. An196]OUP20370.1 pyruvate kinase [Lachnoclostridium sp. An196]HIS06759.1 pyruvate kinase [Candidatus Choladocola avistercoris]
MRKTKIVCTLGPSTESEEVMRQLMLEGMAVARMNFSHGSHEEQKKRLDMVKKLREELHLPVAALLDTKGPEIRIGDVEGGKLELKAGQDFILTTEEMLGTAGKVTITYKELYKDVCPGDSILIDDGLIGMEVRRIDGQDIICKVVNGGFISNHKGVNVPGVELKMPFVSEKDYSDILFAAEQGYDFVAASFTRTAEDILEIRKILDENGGEGIHIIAKIENMQGVENAEAILRVADGMMIARGDMGVEIPLEEVPVIQKKLIRLTIRMGKPVITATQMLDSMMKNPRPTRAETSDVANAIYQGTSAIMLSGETAAGAYPVEAVRTMARIAERTERDIDYTKEFKPRRLAERPDVTSAISHATCTTAMDLHAAAIVAVSKSGRTVGMISKYRPSCPIIGCAMDERVCRQLNLSWGVIPLQLDEEKTADDLFDHAVGAAEHRGLVSRGELVVITAGLPLGMSGTTNMIKVHVAGRILISGKGVNNLKASGNVCVCQGLDDLEQNFRPGDIVVVSQTTNEMMPKLKDAGGIITETGDRYSHAAIVGMALDIPVITSARNATRILKSGAFITVDAEQGTVYSGN